MTSNAQKTLPTPFPSALSSSARTQRTQFDNPLSSNNNPAQVVDISVPVPPRGYPYHTTSDSMSSHNTNPFRTPKHTPHTSNASGQSVFSPVSPIEDSQNQRLPFATARPTVISQTPKMPEPRKSVDLRQLDGKPYPSREEEVEPKPRKVKVAQDMYAGAMPPGYEQQNYSGSIASKAVQSVSCHKCGGHRKSSIGAPVVSNTERAHSAQRAQNKECTRCSGKPQSTPPSSYTPAINAAVQSRPQTIPRPLPTIDSIAGPSSAPSGHRHSCNKCGRDKRPDSISSSASSSQPQSPQHFGATLQHRSIPSIQTNCAPVDINVQPPTAITERAPTLPISRVSTMDDRPLIQHENKERRKLSRGNSISSLFRSLSRRKKNNEEQLPSQKLANSGQQNPNQIIDKISSAIRDGDNSYPQLNSPDRMRRSASPFSFVDNPQEDQAFEMNDMRKSKQPEGRISERKNSWEKLDESALFLDPGRPKVDRSHSTSYRLHTLNEQPLDDTYLGVTPDQRPGVTRFKSLRSGVSRATNGLSRSASQMSRSSSLRRLGSVKKVPQFWYREDMTIEGEHGTEYVVNVY